MSRPGSSRDFLLVFSRLFACNPVVNLLRLWRSTGSNGILSFEGREIDKPFLEMLRSRGRETKQTTVFALGKDFLKETKQKTITFCVCQRFQA